MLWTVRLPSAIHTAAMDRGELLTLLVGRRRSLFFTVDDDEVFMTRSLTLRRRQQNSIQLYDVVNLKPSNNNKRLRSKYYTVEANYWRTQSMERPLCDSRVTCIISLSTLLWYYFIFLKKQSHPWMRYSGSIESMFYILRHAMFQKPILTQYIVFG